MQSVYCSDASSIILLFYYIFTREIVFWVFGFISNHGKCFVRRHSDGGAFVQNLNWSKSNVLFNAQARSYLRTCSRASFRVRSYLFMKINRVHSGSIRVQNRWWNWNERQNHRIQSWWRCNRRQIRILPACLHLSPGLSACPSTYRPFSSFALLLAETG